MPSFDEQEIYLPLKVLVRRMPNGSVHVVLQETVSRLGREFILKDFEEMRDVERRIRSQTPQLADLVTPQDLERIRFGSDE